MAAPLAGVLAIVHTPFDNEDRIDSLALRKAVDWAFSVGANGLGMGMVQIGNMIDADIVFLVVMVFIAGLIVGLAVWRFQ